MAKAQAYDRDRQVKVVLRHLAKYGRPLPGQVQKWAAAWCCSESNASHILSEALRHIRLSRQDFQGDVDIKLSQLEADRQTALAQKRQLLLHEKDEDGIVSTRVVEYPAPDCKSAVRATEIYLHAIGAMVRKEWRKHPEGSLEDLKQKRDAVRVALGDLDAVIEQQEAEVH